MDFFVTCEIEWPPPPHVNQVIFILYLFRSRLLHVYFIGICILWAANKGKPKGLYFWCHSKSVHRLIRARVRAFARGKDWLFSTVVFWSCAAWLLIEVYWSLLLPHCDVGGTSSGLRVCVARRKEWKTLLAESVPIHQKRTELPEKLNSGELWWWPVLSLTEAGKSEVKGGVWASHPQCLHVSLLFIPLFKGIKFVILS